MNGRGTTGWLAVVLALVAPSVAAAQSEYCPQFSPDGQLPVQLSPKLEQRVTVLCNDGYAVTASGEGEKGLPAAVAAPAKLKTVTNPFE